MGAPGINPLQDLSVLSRYGPRTAQALQRSQYLAQALQEMQKSGQDIKGGWGELAARLLGSALMAKGYGKANQGLQQALMADQNEAEAPITAALGKLAPPQAPVVADSGQPPPPPPPAPVVPPGQPAMASLDPRQSALANSLDPNAPRSVRNNNPLNLTTLAKGQWNGQTGADGPFATFADPQSGMAAADRNLQSYHELHGINTLAGAISRWAPPQANNTSAYIATVSKDLGVDPNAPLDFTNPTIRQTVLRSMAKVESGGSPPPFPPQMQPTPVSNPGMGPQGPQAGPQAPPPVPVSLGQPGPGIAPPQSPQAPPSPVLQMAQQTAPMPQGPPQPTLAPVPTQPGPQTPPAPPVDPRRLEFIKSLLQNPQTHQMGISEATKLIGEVYGQPHYSSTTRNGVPILFDQTNPSDVRALPAMPETQSHVKTGKELGLPGDPNASYVVDPNGNIQATNPAPQGFSYAQGGGLQTTQGGPQDPRSPANLVANEEKLRDDYNNAVKPYIAAREGYQKVIQAAKTGTPAGDIALVFGYMKTLDPNSTVREGEQASVQNSGTIPQSVANMYNQLIGGTGKLTPEQRVQFVQAAGQQFGVYQKTKDQADQHYGGIAQSYGFDPKRVIQELPPIEAGDAGGQTLANGWTHEQLQAAQQYRGQQGETPLVPINQHQYDAIPKGRLFIDRSGKVRPKQ